MDIDSNPQVFRSGNTEKGKKTSGGFAAVISFAIFILTALGVIIFLYNQNQTLKKKLALYEAVPTPSVAATPSPTPAANELPVITNPKSGSIIKSPLKVAGTVPAGWMFEGTFPVKLLDSNKNIIAQVGAKETTPGSWTEGENVEFTATLTFKNSSGSGVLILESDNPSGDPKNARSFEMPVTFSGNSVCTLEAKVCPDGSYVGRTGPNCEFAPCP